MPALDPVKPVRDEVAAGCACCGGSRWRPAPLEPEDWEYGVVPDRHFRFVACDGCGTEWLDPRPTEEELVAFYPSGYHAYNDDHGVVASALVSLRARLRARQYHAMMPASGGRLFDVGAGDCRHFEEIARQPGYSFAGVELNPEMAQRARDRGYDVETGTLERMDLRRHAGRYAVVSMNHVLEHVHDPAEVLRRALTLLEPGGWLVGQIPTTSSWEHGLFGTAWAGYHFPRHLQVCSRDGLTQLLTRSGFADVRLRSTPHIQSALSLQNAVVRRGWRPRLRFGRASWFGGLMLACLPFELLAAACGRSGVIDFTARRRAAPTPVAAA